MPHECAHTLSLVLTFPTPLALTLQLIPNDVLETPRHGTIVYHPSLNPRKRDASAINWRWSQTFREGDVKAGFSILFAYDEEGRKTGPTLIARQTDVLPDDDIARLSERFLIPEGEPTPAQGSPPGEGGEGWRWRAVASAQSSRLAA